MKNKAWELSTVSVLSSLKKQPTVNGILINELKYTLLDGEHVSYHDARELAELHEINSKLSPREFVAFRPERLAWHETIVGVSTRIKIENEEDMRVKCMQVYESVLDGLDDLALDKVRQQIKQYVTNLVDDYLEGINIVHRPEGVRVAEICNQITTCGDVFSKYKEGYAAKDAMITRITDVFYTEQANKRISKLVDQKISLFSGLTFLEIPESTERLTLIVAGGQASGKGSSVARLQKSVQALAIQWNNVVKINTDSYKSLLIEPGTVRPELYSQLAQEEASIIHQKIYTRLMQMARQGKAPHIFIDQVFVGEDKINLGLLNKGKVRGVIVSTDVNDAIERSYARGLEDGSKGRYENTQGILRVHKNVCLQFPGTLSKYADEDVSFLLVDNNVAKGKQATDVMGIDLKSGEIEIYSQINLERFIAKGLINVDARSEEDLYLKNDNYQNYSTYLKPLLETGKCKIKNVNLVSSSNPNQYELDYVHQHKEEGIDKQYWSYLL